MDRNAVPFPTTHHPEDPSDKNLAAPLRLHPTPSLPNLSHTHHYSCFPPRNPLQGPARHRPHLRPLDLASSPSSSPAKKDTTDYLGRLPTLLTPPLTPAASLNSTANDTPSTPPDIHSPLRQWSTSHDRQRVAAAHTAFTTALHMSALAPSVTGYLTPKSARSQSLSSDDSTGPGSGPTSVSDHSLASGLASADITPRDERERIPILDSQDNATVPYLHIEEVSNDTPTRFVLVRKVPRDASSKALMDAFCGMGSVRGIMARFLSTYGIIFVAFYDTRHAVRAMSLISNNPYYAFENVRLESAFVSPAQVEQVIGRSLSISDMDGSFFVTVEDVFVPPQNVQNILASFGELASFTAAGTDPHDQTFHVDFYDCRNAANAFKALDKRPILGARFTLFSNKDLLEHPLRLMQSDECGVEAVALISMAPYYSGVARPRSMSTSEGVGTPDTMRKVKKVKEASQDRRFSNDLFFDAVGKVSDPSHALSPSRPRSISASAEEYAGFVKMQQYAGGFVQPIPQYSYPDYPYSPYAHPTMIPAPAMYPAPPHPPMYAYPYPNLPIGPSDPGTVRWLAPLVSRTPMPYSSPIPAPMPVSTPVMLPPWTTPEDHQSTRTSLQGHGDRRRAVDGADVVSSQRAPGAKNMLDISAIENGMDTRTTVMIKNIPNKMTDKDLKAFIDRVCPRRIDFMYLRMDFQNGCNVGYAFVNFITVQDLLVFAKSQIGVKWNMYSSEKTLQMCYATYQGKESLVEKFKNSCIMDEKDAWRPKIYYSDGPNKGLPEPFPPPTHLRRKERSQHNRGSLFVPGTNHHASAGGGALYHHRPHPLACLRDDCGCRPALYNHASSSMDSPSRLLHSLMVGAGSLTRTFTSSYDCYTNRFLLRRLTVPYATSYRLRFVTRTCSLHSLIFIVALLSLQ
ncbi:RNA recognition motif 2-domain-containing protein [Daedaleopsis nitida]|nr:RNA recognition motif 2-domain-containing protein [Daedaleopsis nitida]